MTRRSSRRGGRQPGAGGGLDRRQFLIRAGVLGGAVVIGPGVLAACGDDDDDGSASGGGGGGDGSQLVIANWPFYIDEDTIPLFQDETGITVEYIEEVNDNNEWFAKYQEQLSRGDAIGRDIVVLTDWMATRMINLGYVEEIDAANVPNKANLRAPLASPSFDPDRTYTLPWFSGIAGIAYDPELTGFEITSVNDIFDERLAGRVTMLTEARDSLGLVMLGMGIDPTEATQADIEAAAARITEARDSGQLLRFTGNDYGADLASGNAAASFGWSGDVVQLQLDNPNLQFVVPDEGGMLWSDNMMIVKNAANKANAEAFMDYVYDPVNAARMTSFVQFISPVEGAAEELEQLDPETAANPLVVPTPEMDEQLYIFRGLDEDEEQQLNELWQEVIRA